MNKRYLAMLLIVFCGMGLFVYNYWSYSCGRCNTESLLSLSAPAGILIGVNLLAFLALMFIKARRRRSTDPMLCACGAKLHTGWHFCPCCGQACPNHS